MLFAVSIFAGFFALVAIVGAEEKSGIRIVEIMFDPDGSDSKREWIEVYNAGSEKIDLEKWKLMEVDTNHSIKDCSDKVLKEGERLVIADNKDTFLEEHGEYEGVVCDSSFSLKNTGEMLALWDGVTYDRENEEKEEYAFEIDYSEYAGDVEIGHSLEMCEDKKWQQSAVAGGSPGEKNCEVPDIPTHVRITELLPDPTDVPDKEGKFVELYNYGEEGIDLQHWKIDKKKLEGTLKVGEYKVFYGATGLKNSGKDTVTLYGPLGEVERVSYEDAPHGKSYAFDGSKWRWTPIITPGEENMFPRAAKDARIRLGEILPNPEGDESGEFIELYNAGSEDVDLQYWTLSDKSKAYTFTEKTLFRAGAYLVLKRDVFKFAINNSGETITLADGVGNVIDRAVLNTSKEGVSLGRDGVKWRACKKLTPGKKNVLNALPRTKDSHIPKEAFKDVYAEFSVKTKDEDKDTVKVRWDFGDGHKSYLEEARHRYEKTGKYTVLLQLDDGREIVEKSYRVKVEKYPKRKVGIVAILPNPVGKDSEGEMLIVKNSDRHVVNLEGWSVASGSKKGKLSNHPIRESFKIRAGEKKVLTRGESKFSLGNKTLYLELRYPDGRVAQKMNFDREKSVREGILYSMQGDVWVWVGDQIEKKNQASAQAVEETILLPQKLIGGVSRVQFDIPGTLNMLSWSGEEQVSGVQIHRLDTRATRYVFTHAVSEIHYAKAWLRHLKMFLTQK